MNRLVAAGRLITTVGVVAFMLLRWKLGSMRFSIEHIDPYFLVITAATTFAFLIGWPLAIFHWAFRYRGDRKPRILWGITVILGSFFGACWYFWLGANDRRTAARNVALE